MKWGRHNRNSLESAKAKFIAKTLPSEDGCINWIGAVGSHKRYGIVGIAGKHWLAHRAAWFLFKGDPSGFNVCHKCDNGLCVNVEHLFLGTQKDNVRDMESKQRSNHPSGAAHGRAKLTAEDVASIRARWPNESATTLAKAFGVSRPTISRIVNGSGWNAAYQQKSGGPNFPAKS